MATGAQAVAKAKSQDGIAEIGYTNNVKFNTWFYGRGVSGAAYPWCAAFTSWVYDQLGMKADIDYPRSAGVAVCFNWYISKGRKVSKYNLKPGDQVRYTFSHTGIFSHYNSAGTPVVWEGNTSPGNSGSQRDGGGVHLRTRPFSLIQYGGRPNFTTTAATTAPPTPPEPKGVLGMTKRINHYRKKTQKATGTRHLMINDKGDYTIVAGPAEAVISAKADIGGLKAGQHGFLILAEVMYKKGQPTVISRELATVKVTANTVWSVAGAWTLPKTHNGKSPRIRLIFKTSSKTATAHNVYISGVRD